jgi:hypothetical protein
MIVGEGDVAPVKKKKSCYCPNAATKPGDE